MKGIKYIAAAFLAATLLVGGSGCSESMNDDS